MPAQAGVIPAQAGSHHLLLGHAGFPTFFRMTPAGTWMRFADSPSQARDFHFFALPGARNLPTTPAGK